MSPAEGADPRHLVVGHISKAHGTRGDLFVKSLTDHPEGTYAPGVVLLPGGAEVDEPDPDLPPLRIRAARPFRNGQLVSFHGVDDRNQAELLRGYYLYRSVEELEPLAEGEVFHHELIGMEVVTADGTHVGEVTEVYELSPADLLEVRGEDREHMIPFLEQIVIEIDREARRIVVEPPEGLLDL